MEQSEQYTWPLYEALIHTFVAAPHFVERVWLADQIVGQLAEPDCRFLLLTGEPGSGKTAMMAWLASRHPDWLCYFIRRDSQTPLSGGDTRSFLFALGHQLAAQRPGLFQPQNLEVVLDQRIDRVEKGGYASGISIEDLRASPFLQTALKVTQNVGIVAGELQGLSVKRAVIEERFLELGNLQHLALLDPAQVLLRQNPHEQIVVLVDALDELRYQPGHDSILDWLTACPELPPNVRVIVSTRPELLLEAFRSSQHPWLREVVIEPESPQVASDLRRFMEGFVNEKSIQATLAQYGIEAAAFKEGAVVKADGNFQYVVALTRAIVQELAETDLVEDDLAKSARAALRRLLLLHDVPRGLSELYHFFLSRIRLSVAGQEITVAGVVASQDRQIRLWEDVYQPILGLLSVAREPLSVGQLASYGGVEAEGRWLQSVLLRLRQFLDQHGNSYRLYHSTMAEYITSKRTLASYPADYLDPAEWHGKIVRFYQGTYPSWADIDWGSVDDYGMRHLAAHLHAVAHLEDETGRQERAALYRTEFYGLICASFVRAKMAREGTYQAVTDAVLLSIDLAETAQPPNLLEEVRASWVYSTLRELAMSASPLVLGVLTQLGQERRALDLAALIMDANQRCEAYLLIGSAMLEHGHSSQAAKAFEEALSAGEQSTEVIGYIGKAAVYDPTQKAELLSRTASALVSVGDARGLERVLRAAETIEDARARDVALKAVERAKERLNTPDHLSDQPIGSEESQTKPEGQIAQQTSDVKQTVMSLETARRQLRDARELRQDRAQALSRAADALAQAGNCVTAVEVVREVLAYPVAALYDMYGPDTLILVADVAASCRDREGVHAALQKAQQIDDKTFRSTAIRHVAIALVVVGELDLALDAIATIPYRNQHTPARGEVAQALLRVGERESAMSVVERVLADTNSLTDNENRSDTLRSIALALAEIGETTKAIAMLELAVAAAMRIDESVEESSSPVAEVPQATALGRLALDLARLGEATRAISLAEAILQEVYSWTGYSKLFIHDVVGWICATFARAGIAERAIEVASRFGGTAWSLEWFAEIADILSEAGESTPGDGIWAHLRARLSEVLEQVAWGNGKANLQDVVRIRTHLRDFELAASTARQIGDPYDRALSLGIVGRAYAQARQGEAAQQVGREALEALEEMERAATSPLLQTQRVYVLSRIAALLMDAGDQAGGRALHTRALGIIPDIADLRYRARAVVILADGFALANDRAGLDALLDAVEEISNAAHQVEALAGVVEGLGKVGATESLARAVEIAQRLPDAVARTRAQLTIAQVLVKAGRKEQGVAAWHAWFKEVRLSGRPEVLRGITDGASVLAAYDHGRTLWEMTHVLMGVDEWWRVRWVPPGIISLKDLTHNIELYNTLISRGHYDEAVRLLLEMLFPDGLDRLPHQSSLEWQSYALNTLTNTLNSLANSLTEQPERAASLYRLHNDIQEKIGDLERVCVGLCKLSNVLRLSGKLYESEAAARRATLISRKLSEQYRKMNDFGWEISPADLENPYERQEATCLYWLGVTLAVRGIEAESAKALEQSLILARIRNGYVAYDYQAMRALWFGQYSDAQELASRAMVFYQQYPFERGMIRAARLQGAAALGLGDLSIADERLHYALAHAQAANFVEEDLPALVGLAEIRQRQGDLKAARELLDDLWEPAERGPYRLYHTDACNLLAQIERDAGNLAAAVTAASAAYRLAWCDGPPFAYHRGLQTAKAHLSALSVPELILPPFDASKHEPMPDIEI